MDIKKIWVVIKKEYITRVRSKAFMIGTLLGPIAFVAMIVIPVFLTRVEGEQQRRIAVIDLSEMSFAPLKQYLSENNQREKYILENVITGKKDLDLIKKELIKKIYSKEINAYIIIGRDFLEGGRPEYHSKHVSNFLELKTIQDALTKVAIKLRLQKDGLSADRVGMIIKDVDLKVLKVEEKGIEQEERGQTFFFSYILLIMLYTTVLLYGVAIMRSVIEDKNSRMVEILASSIRSFDLMLGKLIGVGAVGLTQYLIWSIIAILVLLYGTSVALILNPAVVISSIPSLKISTFIYFIIFFLLGYFLYSTFYIIIGSMVDNEQDAQNIQMPVVILLIIPMMVAPLILSHPDSNVSVILSLIPLLTPIIMFLRINVLTPPFYQIMISMILTLLTTLFMVWIAARIYRIGMLIYGKKVTLPEIIRWARKR